jgi:membrane protein implicated in regulation of membrane protease activity
MWCDQYMGTLMAESTLWWLATGAAVGIELVTGTFYLLMLAIGMAAGALAAHAGAGPTTQLVVAAIVGGGAVVLWHQIRKRRAGDPSVRSLRSVNLDVGETVMVTAWQGDGTAQVKYRGANWTAIHRPGVIPATGAHRVSELVGTRLLVDKIP